MDVHRVAVRALRRVTHPQVHLRVPAEDHSGRRPDQFAAVRPRQRKPEHVRELDEEVEKTVQCRSLFADLHHRQLNGVTTLVVRGQ